MEKININQIRGRWQDGGYDRPLTGGDDTVESIKLVAEKVNEIIEVVNKLEEIRKFNEDRQIRMVQV